MPLLDLDGKTRELADETSVGSGSQATWRVQNKDLAARHFTVQVNGSAATIVPASPQSVVILNGTQVPPAGSKLSAGDVISAGAAHFVYLKKESDPRPELPAAPALAHLIDAKGRKAYPLSKRIVQVGREVGCNIVLRDTSVSRFHADFRAEAGQSVLYSMGSGGTKVNGEAMKHPRVLEEGDEIRIGGTTFTFTRSTLPQGTKIVELEDHRVDALNSRATVVMGKVATTPAELTIDRGFPTVPVLLGLALVGGVIAFFVMG